MASIIPCERQVMGGSCGNAAVGWARIADLDEDGVEDSRIVQVCLLHFIELSPGQPRVIQVIDRLIQAARTRVLPP